MHLINPAAASSGELHEAVAKLRDLNTKLEGAQYARFWAALDGDDLCADLIADIAGFEDLVRERIAGLMSQAFRELALGDLEQWLGFNSEDKTRKFASDQGWSVEGDVVKVPRNADNEAKKSEIREDVGVEMFGRVIKRSWEEALAM
jgi:translation initiation factor 3 subunit K